MIEAWPDIFYEGYIHQFQEYIHQYINSLTKFTGSSRCTEFKDILPWNIYQMITKTVPISTRIIISYAMKRSIPLWIRWKVNGNWANSMIRIFQWNQNWDQNDQVSQLFSRGKAILEQILTSEEINKSKRAILWQPQPGIQVGMLTIWVRSFEIEKLYQSSPGLSVPPK